MVNANFTGAKARRAEMAAKADETNAAGRTAPLRQRALGQNGNQDQSRLIKVNQAQSRLTNLNSHPSTAAKAAKSRGGELPVRGNIAEVGGFAAIQNQPQGNPIVVNRAKSSQIASGVRPSRPQKCAFAPNRRASGRSATTRRRFPRCRAIQPIRVKSPTVVVIRAKSSLIVVNGEPGKPRLRRLSKRVKPRQTTFPDTGASIHISEVSSWPSLGFHLAIFH